MKLPNHVASIVISVNWQRNNINNTERCKLRKLKKRYGTKSIVDLWAPATINNKNGKQSMHLMTMIDPVRC